MICAIVDYRRRAKALKWLHENTTMMMASGSYLFPFTEIDHCHGDVVFRATKHGLEIVIPFYQGNNGTIKNILNLREFCQKVKMKFPLPNEPKSKPIPFQQTLGFKTHRAYD